MIFRIPSGGTPNNMGPLDFPMTPIRPGILQTVADVSAALYDSCFHQMHRCSGPENSTP